MDLIIALLPLLIFFIIITRIMKFLGRILEKIQEAQEQQEKNQQQEFPSAEEDPLTTKPQEKKRRKKRKKTPSDSRGRQKSDIPAEFELDLSDIDDKFGEKSAKREKTSLTKSQPMETETSDASKIAEKARQEKRKQDKDKSWRPEVVDIREDKTDKPSAKKVHVSDMNLKLTKENIYQAIIMKEVLSSPRSKRPYIYSYRRQD